VTEFARERVRSVIGHVRPAEGPHDVERAATDIATALSGAGYASSVEEAGSGLQICQHHCPVWNVASRFPELCAAEQEVVSEIVGTHVQRLATIAGGNCACTTNIPTGTVTVSDLAATIPAPADASASAPTAERTVR
ncbi:transcriptional regulator, partial [Dietzia sp. SLG510A3-30A2]|nr:transcriptional regulator [Dietzia sp. SLG510A3-30A2]